MTQVGGPAPNLFQSFIAAILAPFVGPEKAQQMASGGHPQSDQMDRSQRPQMAQQQRNPLLDLFKIG